MNGICRFFVKIIFIFPSVIVLSQTHSSKAEKHTSHSSKTAYTNPVLQADFSDPDVIRVGQDYFMTASSFNCVPGLPILHSTDLIHWEIVNYALQKLTPEEVYNQQQHGKGVWAPCLRYHNDEYYLYYPNPDYGIYLTKAKDPYGSWTEPVLVKKGEGLIDPSPLWDEDGKVYLVYALAGSRAGIKSLLLVCRLNSEGTQTNGDDIIVFDGHDAHPTVEGPKFYKRNAYYYIFAPAGGVKTGWQLVLRSKSVFGPYEVKTVLEQGNTEINGPHQGAWVTTAKGEDWFIHFQDKGAYGRIVHLQPMTWENDWPVIGIDTDENGIGNPLLRYGDSNPKTDTNVSVLQTSDEFDTPRLGLQWQWHANPQLYWGYPTSMGYFSLFCLPWPDDAKNLWDIPQLLLQKFPAETFTVTTKLTLYARQNGDRAGLLVMGKDYSYLQIKYENNQYFLSQVQCKDADKAGSETELERKAVQSSTIYLKLIVGLGGKCTYQYSEDAQYYFPIGQEFTAKEGLWIGAKIGLFAMGDYKTNDAGSVAIDWFRIEY